VSPPYDLVGRADRTENRPRFAIERLRRREVALVARKLSEIVDAARDHVAIARLRELAPCLLQKLARLSVVALAMSNVTQTAQRVPGVLGIGALAAEIAQAREMAARVVQLVSPHA
jgi:hypothetical protein